MREQTEAAVATLAGSSGASQSMPVRAPTGLAFSVAIAALALAAGAGLIRTGLAWAPPRSSAQESSIQAISQGAQLYAAECGSCHGARLEGQAAESQAVPTRSNARLTWSVPPLGRTGHAWRHSDAKLAVIVARGTKGAAQTDGTPDMPAFAERLGPHEINAILAYVKSRWPANIQAYQATLKPDGGGVAPATLQRDPTWTYPSLCLSLPATAESP